MGGNIRVDDNLLQQIKNYEYSGAVSDGRLVSIVILTYNQLNYTKLCIESIRKFTKSGSYELIIVDNYSTDDTRQWLSEQEDLTVIYNDENKGFPAGCNQGIAIAKGDSVLLLNNDVIVTPNWLSDMCNALWSDDNIAGVGCVTNYISYYQKVESEYNSFEEMLAFSNNYRQAHSSELPYRIKLVGFCLLLKKKILDKVGVLDEIFTPGNYEDDDLSFRLICAGYDLVLCKGVFIHHFGSVSFNTDIEKYITLGRKMGELFYKKWKFDPGYSTGIRFELVDIMQEADCSKPIKILEIGCGAGATLAEIKSRYKNAELYGIEIDKHAAVVAQGVGNVLINNVETMVLPYEDNFFDYIILGDVIEHLIDPWSTLNKLHPFLACNGRLIASIPNVMHISVIKNLLSGSFSYVSAGILDKTHLRFFTLHEIAKLFMGSNFEILSAVPTVIETSEEEKALVNTLSAIENGGESLKTQYYAYQYRILSRKQLAENSEQYIELRSLILRIDSNLDVDSNARDVLALHSIYGDFLINEVIRINIIEAVNSNKVFNTLGAVAFEIGKVDLSLKLLMYAYSSDTLDEDTVFNLCFVLHETASKEKSLEILTAYEKTNSLSEELHQLKAMLYNNL